MANVEFERIAIEHVMQLERDAGREPVDVHSRGVPYDIASSPRKIQERRSAGQRAEHRFLSNNGSSKPPSTTPITTTRTSWTTSSAHHRFAYFTALPCARRSKAASRASPTGRRSTPAPTTR